MCGNKPQARMLGCFWVATVKRLAVIPGDGIGQEVTDQGLKVLEALRSVRSIPLEWEVFDLGADRYLRDGTTLPTAVLNGVRERFAAVLLGALGDSRVPDQVHARDILFGLRFGLDLYCNVRPVRCLHERLMPLKGRVASDADFVVFRENTEGSYNNLGGTFKSGTPDEVAIGQDVNSRKGVERILRAAFSYAVKEGYPSVCMADKSNAMPHAHGIWRRCFDEIAGEFPSIRARHMYVDALCLAIVQNPAEFGVIVACNLFGDIVSDLAASLQGGLGMAASGNIHPGRASLFEPVHGSAPELAGKNRANPIAMVLTIAMMLDHVGFDAEKKLVTAAVQSAIDERQCTPDVGGSLGTAEAGDWLTAEVRRLAESSS